MVDTKRLARQMQAFLSLDTEAVRMIQAMPDVIELPTMPLLQTHLLPPELDSVAVLVLDVNDSDRTRGLRALEKLENLVVPIGRAPWAVISSTNHDLNCRAYCLQTLT